MKNTEKKFNIDVVIPVAEKDIKTLDMCITGVKNNLWHNIQNIYIISKPFSELLNICNNQNCIFIDENEYLGFDKSDLVNVREDRQGWLFQQLIKLKGNPGQCRSYFVIDSDIILVKPQKFINDEGDPIFAVYPNHIMHDYNHTNFNLTGIENKRNVCFVDDKMMFNINIIYEIHQKLKEHTGLNWIDAIISKYDNNANYGFSEFELYALLFGDRPHDEVKKYNVMLKYNSNYTYEQLRKRYCFYDCVSMHHYL